MKTEKIISSYNKKITYEYNIIKQWEAGMCLDGDDVKILRKGRSVVGSFAVVKNNRIWLRNLFDGYDVALLMHKKEMTYLVNWINKGGYSMQILELYNTRGWFKVTLCLCTYKSKQNRKEIIKKRDIERSIRMDKYM